MKAKQKPGVVFQPHVHRALQHGIRKLVSAIRPTLGPLSGGVAIDPLNEAETLPEYVDEGAVIARRIIELPDRNEDMGAMLLRAMLTRQQERIGDGTATAAVLFEAIFDGGLRYIAAGGNAMQLRRTIEGALPVILSQLDAMAFHLEGKAALTNLARSLSHDEEAAELLGDAFDLVGEHGRLEIREDYGRGLRQEYVEGNYFHSGMFSRVFANEQVEPRVKLENPSIFVCDFEIEEHQKLFPILQAANAASVNALVIVARNLSEKAIALLETHNRMGKFNVVGIKLPGHNPADRMAALDDLSLLTGATPFLTVTADSMEQVSARHFGQARRFWADLRTFGIVGGKGDPVKLREHVALLRTRYATAQDVDERKAIQERIGNLLGGAVTIWVGGFTEPEIRTRKNHAQRVALSMRAAVQEGVVPGGGIAYLACREALEPYYQQARDSDERAAYRILREALAAPARTIFHNAGYDPSEIMARLGYEQATTGFDVRADRIVDMREAGIVDSLIVAKTSLQNAIKTASLALTIDALVHLAAPEMVGNPQ